jgi:RNA polymerase sigma-70 factor (ECF subfamily)
MRGLPQYSPPMIERVPPGATLDDTPDEALVHAVLRGDETASTRLVRRYLRKAMAVALTYVDTLEDAEDVVQETFQRAFQSLRRYDASKPFQPWFFTILRNTARTARTVGRARRHEELLTSRPTETASPLEDTQRVELEESIDIALGRLPRMQQACFRLCVVEGFSSAEAASAVGIAESTVRVHLFKARRALRGRLEGLQAHREEA